MPSLSQTTLNSNQRVKKVIDENGQPAIQISVADAKTILIDILDKPIVDSLLKVYIERDSLKSGIITLQIAEISKLQQKCENQSLMIRNLEKIVENKDSEITLKDDTIKQQKKEIRKQKFLKIVGFIGSVVLPITAIILTTH